MSFREIKHAARRVVHETMRVPAYYYPPKRLTGGIPCEIRVHSKQAEHGDLKGTNFSYAETAEVVPRIIWWWTELTPHQNGHFQVGTEEVYRIGIIEPVDGPTQSAQVAQLEPAQARAYVMP